MADWQIEKSRLNHGWLRNSILAQLRLEEKYLATREDICVLKATLEEWRTHHDEIREMIERFIPAESPQNVLSEVPLSRLGNNDRQWLAKVIHECWLKRTLATSVVHEALEAFQQCRKNYMELSLSFSEVFVASEYRPHAASDQELKLQDDRYSDLSKHIRKFARSVYALSEAISQFPFNARFK